MKVTLKQSILCIFVLLAAGVIAQARTMHRGDIVVPKGTEVTLVFDQSLNSKKVKVGQSVKLHVKRDLKVDGATVIRGGTPVSGVVEDISKRKSYGINASMRISLNPVKSVSGKMITLQPRTKGKELAGKKSTQAAGATIGGAALLGPVGLVGGYFIHGKEAKIKVGDKLETEVAYTTTIRR